MPTRTTAKRGTHAPKRSAIEMSPEQVRKSLGRLQGDVTTGGRHLLRDLRSTRNALRRDLRSLGRGFTPHRTVHK